MPPRRERSYEERLGRNKMIARWEIERDVVRFAVTLLAEVDGPGERLSCSTAPTVIATIDIAIHMTASKVQLSHSITDLPARR